MLDQVFLSVSDLDRAVAFYAAALAPLGIVNRHDYDGKDGPPGHPDLKGFGAHGRMFFWLKHGAAAPGAVHLGFAADSAHKMDAAHAAAASMRPGRSCTTMPATMRRKYAIWTATAWSSCIKAGSMAHKVAAPLAQQRAVADALIAACNAFDAARAVALFTPDAVIDDPSTGHHFHGSAGVRDYLERYFPGYRTVTRFLAIRHLGGGKARVRVDFTGDFGHETGVLDLTLAAHGSICRIDASLE